MTSPIYRQNDSRWSKIKYPKGKYNIGSSGCGCMATLHCVIEQPKYANYKPKDIVGFMRQYATMGNGTKWVGIKKGLEHYGYKAKQIGNGVISNPSSVWTELNKGNRIGVIRMISGKRGGVRWTSSGHYIMFQDYKVKNGKHYFKIKDSGYRHNDGWFCYETTMKGMFGPVFIAERKDPKVQNLKPYPKELPEATIKLGASGEDVRRWQRFLNHVYGEVPKADPVTVDGKYGLKTDAWTGCFQVYCDITEDSIVGQNTINHAKRWGR